ncbi:class I SAM-dependent methyltransferase [Komagataeibacter kakiaceti]|uniref:hypothetical protein n=1 Tax=Komagataeibacter kakiaceti TaxID=943261 RepID=UPI0011DD03B9|nr:hypothetical protein [Komagataeibacter kakiaceti]
MKLLNTHIASEKNIHGARVAQTVLGKEGHVIWGPYETRAPGRYKVIFCISGIDLTGCADGDCVAIADVACNNGQDILGVRYIAAGELRAGQTHFEILFSALTNKYSVEYRVSVQGNARLEIDTYRPVTDEATLSSDIIFPKLDENSPTFFRDNIDILRRWYESDFRVMIKGDDVIMTKDGISFYAKVRDDINLIGEIFLEKVYRFERRRPTVVMDVGMNIGLVSMQFAKNPTVQKIYSFEPFPSTYDRAIANLSSIPN